MKIKSNQFGSGNINQREPKIISGKDQLPLYKDQIIAMATGLAASGYFEPNSMIGDTQNDLKNSCLTESGDLRSSIRKKNTCKTAVDQAYFPNLIFNNGIRSTSYSRNARSSDFINAKNSPLATRLIYNWKPMERETTKSVQSRIKVYKPQKRMEIVARPTSPYRVKSDWETVVPHFHNEKRTIEMKRLQYLKDHTGWSVYPYAGVEEKEHYNKNIRDTLKKQIDQKGRLIKHEFENNKLEVKYTIEQDQHILNEDKRKRIDKLKALTNYRNENKQLMQDRWMNEYISKRVEWQQDSQLLGQDPINWSKTLK